MEDKSSGNMQHIMIVTLYPQVYHDTLIIIMQFIFSVLLFQTRVLLIATLKPIDSVQYDNIFMSYSFVDFMEVHHDWAIGRGSMWLCILFGLVWSHTVQFSQAAHCRRGVISSTFPERQQQQQQNVHRPPVAPYPREYVYDIVEYIYLSVLCLFENRNQMPSW